MVKPDCKSDKSLLHFFFFFNHISQKGRGLWLGVMFLAWGKKGQPMVKHSCTLLSAFFPGKNTQVICSG